MAERQRPERTIMLLVCMAASAALVQACAAFLAAEDTAVPADANASGDGASDPASDGAIPSEGAAVDAVADTARVGVDAAACSPVPSAVAQDTFEIDCEGWTTSGGGGCLSSKEQSSCGSGAAQICISGSSAVYFSKLFSFGAQALGRFQLDFDFRNAGANTPFNVAIKATNSLGGTLGSTTSDVSPSSTSWEHVQITLPVPTGATMVAVTVTIPKGPGCLFADELLLQFLQ
jgi:hypothetical protein